jgi:O-antigen ligase
LVKPSKIKERLDFPALLAASYFWGFVLLRQILQANIGNSTLILAVFSIVMLAGIIVNGFIKRTFILSDKIIPIYFLVIIADVIFRENRYSLQYMYQFIYIGIVPSILIFQVRNYSKLLYYYSLFSIPALLIYGLDPINGYVVFTGYMDFGFNLALPVFFGAFIGFHHFRLKWMVIPEVIILGEMVVYANRSVLLSVALFVLLYFLLKAKKGYSYRTVIIFIAILTTLFLNLERLVSELINILNNYDINSYSLNQIRHYLLVHDIEALYSGRYHIWQQALSELSKSPIIGQGIGSFQAKYGYYSHNVFLDILIFHGIGGFLLFVYLSSKTLKRIFNSTTELQITGILFLCMWFPKLFFSSHFLNETGFWAFLIYMTIVGSDRKLTIHDGKYMEPIIDENSN